MKIKFIATIRKSLFVGLIEREIFNRIFPHLEHEKNYGYSFHSDEEFQKQYQSDRFEIEQFVATIESRAERMPKAYGEAFRYIAYRDIKARMKMYEQLAEQRVQPEMCEPRFVARHI